VLQEISARFNTLLNAWFEQPDPIYQGLLKLRSQLVSILVPKVGWEYPDEENYLTTMLRTLVIKMAGSSGDPEYVYFKVIFSKFIYLFMFDLI
jgi:aminopeptidase 2